MAKFEITDFKIYSIYIMEDKNQNQNQNGENLL